MANPELEKHLDGIRALFERERALGREEAWSAIDEARRKIKPSDELPPTANRERAPLGQSRALVDKVLMQNGLGAGFTPMQIFNSPDNVDKQVSYGAIRKILRKGKEQSRYRNKDGKWRMVQFTSASAA
jgi:hypothetical protein